MTRGNSIAAPAAGSRNKGLAFESVRNNFASNGGARMSGGTHRTQSTQATQPARHVVHSEVDVAHRPRRQKQVRLPVAIGMKSTTKVVLRACALEFREALIWSRKRDQTRFGPKARCEPPRNEDRMHLSAQITQSLRRGTRLSGCAGCDACIVALLAKLPSLASSRRLAFIRAWVFIRTWRNARLET